MNVLRVLGRHAVVPAAVAVVIGGAMGLSAAAHASGTSEIAPAASCVVVHAGVN
jgi:hypothetical protein